MFDKIEIYDFCQFEKAELNLKKRGLVWVSGENRDTKAATSNGAGKSTLARAVTFCLYGKVIDRSSRNDEIGDAVIREGQKKATVQIFLSSGWRITRERSKGKPSLLLFQPDGTEFTGGDIQQRIIELIGLDFHGFKNTCLFGQNDTSRFASPDISDAKRKDMLHKLLRTEVLVDCSIIAKNRLKEAKAISDGLETSCALISTKIEGLDIESKKADFYSWEERRILKLGYLKDEIVALKEKAASVASGVSRTAEDRTELARLEKLYEGLSVTSEGVEVARRAVDEASAKIRECVYEIKDLNAELVRIKEAFDSLKGEKCEVCDSDLKTGAPKEKSDSLKNKFRLIKAQVASSNEKKTNFESIFNKETKDFLTKQDLLERKTEKHDEIACLKEKIAKGDASGREAKAILNNAKDKLTTRRALKIEVNPYSEALKKAEDKNIELSAEFEEKRKLANAATRNQNLIEFWVKGFGISGLQSFVLDEPMPYLTERANHYLETLADGDIEVEFKTQRDTKGGALKDEIKIDWTIEGVPNKTPSGGQEQKIEIATDFSFMDLSETREGTTPDIFIADEIMDNLDDIGSERVMDLLSDLRKRRGTILVISHKPNVSEIFEKNINIVKEGGISRIEGT